MSNIDSYRVVPQREIEMQTLLGTPLRVMVREVRLEVAEGFSKAEADLEVAGEIYARCVVEGQFGLDAPERGEGPDPEHARPVRIVARLRPHLAASVARAEDPMRALIDHLFTPPAALAHGDAWRALDVTQAIDEVGVSMGYQTIWSRGD
jgi:hypothetical protein